MPGESYTKTSRCWPGYEPVPGKSEHEEHSCRKKSKKKQAALGGERGRKAKAAGPQSTAQKTAAKKAAKKKPSPG
jgi:hypothetical protein